jgi:hypothetical protein
MSFTAGQPHAGMAVGADAGLAPQSSDARGRAAGRPLEGVSMAESASERVGCLFEKLLSASGSLLFKIW